MPPACWPLPRDILARAPYSDGLASIAFARGRTARAGPFDGIPSSSRWNAEKEAALESNLALESTLRGRRFKSCAVVGSSPSLLDHEDGDLIDSHDAVIRSNLAPTPKRLARHVGRRTTLRILNPTTTAYSARRLGRDTKAPEFTLTTVDMREFLSGRPTRLLQQYAFFTHFAHGESDLLGDWRAHALCNLFMLLASSRDGDGRATTWDPREVEARFASALPNNYSAWPRWHPMGPTVPRGSALHCSTGSHAVVHALLVCERVTLFGYHPADRACNRSRGLEHYWDRATAAPLTDKMTVRYAAHARFYRALENACGLQLRVARRGCGARGGDGGGRRLSVRAGRRARVARKDRQMGVEKLNKTLVCVIGSVRGGDRAHWSLVEQVLRPLQADLAVLVGFREKLGSSVLLSHATHVWRVPEARGWNALLDELVPRWKSVNRSLLRDNVWGGVVPGGGRGLPLKGSGAIIFSLRMVLLGYLDALRGHHYHAVVLTRSDHLYGCAHPRLPISEGVIHIPEGEDYWGGVTDRHAIFAFASRAKALRVLPWLVENDSAAIGNPEQAMWKYLAAQQLWIERFPRPMVVVMQQGDANRWGTTTTEPMPGACGADAAWLKYSSEYVLMAGTCNLTMEPCPSHAQTATANFLRWCDRQRTFNASSPLRGCGLKLRATHRAAARRARRERQQLLASQNATARRLSQLDDRCTAELEIKPQAGARGGNGCDLSAPSPLFETGLDDDSLPGGAGGDGLGSCAVVSSAGEMSGSGCGRRIDAHDAVFRVNHAPTLGYETDVGGRTSIVALNSHNARRLAHLLFHRNTGRARQQLCSMNATLLFYGDEWTAADNETSLVEQLRRARQRTLRQACGAHFVGLHGIKLRAAFGYPKGVPVRRFRQAVRKATGVRPGIYPIPSAGFYAVHVALALCRRVRLYGFGADAATARLHYYRQEEADEKRNREAASTHHRFDVEKALFADLARQPKVTVCAGGRA